MVSRNELLGQMQRPQSAEEKLRELVNLRHRQNYLDKFQKNRLEELEQWHEEYLESLKEPFQRWAYHPIRGGRLFKDKQEYEDAMGNGWFDSPAKAKKTKTAESRQEIIEKEFKEEIQEEKSIDRGEYLIFLKRTISSGSGEKMLYHYTVKELRDAYVKLGLEVDESLTRIDLYKNLKKHVEANI